MSIPELMVILHALVYLCLTVLWVLAFFVALRLVCRVLGAARRRARETDQELKRRARVRERLADAWDSDHV